MIIGNEINMCCQACLKGHRSNSCIHYSRIAQDKVQLIKKRGRPHEADQLAHNRDKYVVTYVKIYPQFSATCPRDPKLVAINCRRNCCRGVERPDNIFVYQESIVCDLYHYDALVQKGLRFKDLPDSVITTGADNIANEGGEFEEDDEESEDEQDMDSNASDEEIEEDEEESEEVSEAGASAISDLAEAPESPQEQVNEGTVHGSESSSQGAGSSTSSGSDYDDENYDNQPRFRAHPSRGSKRVDRPRPEIIEPKTPQGDPENPSLGYDIQGSGIFEGESPVFLDENNEVYPPEPHFQEDVRGARVSDTFQLNFSEFGRNDSGQFNAKQETENNFWQQFKDKFDSRFSTLKDQSNSTVFCDAILEDPSKICPHISCRPTSRNVIIMDRETNVIHRLYFDGNCEPPLKVDEFMDLLVPLEHVKFDLADHIKKVEVISGVEFELLLKEDTYNIPPPAPASGLLDFNSDVFEFYENRMGTENDVSMDFQIGEWGNGEPDLDLPSTVNPRDLLLRDLDQDSHHNDFSPNL